MDIYLVVEFVALFLLLGLSAFFSSSETSLFSLSPTQIQQMRRDRNPRLNLIEELLAEPRRLIATILIGNELVNVSASVLSATIIISLFGADKSWLNIIIMVPLLLLVGEITPKTLALANNVAFATFQSRYIDLFARAISPLRTVVRAVSELFIKLIIRGEHSKSNILTEDMVRSLTKAAVGEGSLHSKESAYIHQIFDFGNKTVGDLMTRRSQMVSVELSMTLANIVAVQRETRRSKLPVFSADGESLIGVLFARDLLPLYLGEHTGSDRAALKKILRKPYLVPESRMAADLFLRLRDRRSSLALVTDEFGGIIGLVTLEDLLECIFGELPSGSDSVTDTQLLETVGTGLYRASGNMPLRQFNDAAGTHFEAPGVTTLAGLVLRACGELPAKNDVVIIDGATFTVTGVTRQRILNVTVQVSAPRRPKADQTEVAEIQAKPVEAADSSEPRQVEEPDPASDEPELDAGGAKEAEPDKQAAETGRGPKPAGG